jgi:hypothetical protein
MAGSAIAMACIERQTVMPTAAPGDCRGLLFAFLVRRVVDYRFAVLSRNGRLVAVVDVTVMSPREVTV